jgi:hypothetical protein
VAGGGPSSRTAPISSNALMVVGIAVVSAGASWSFYYLLREGD